MVRPTSMVGIPRGWHEKIVPREHILILEPDQNVRRWVLQKVLELQ